MATRTKHAELHKIDIGLNDEQRSGVIKILNRVLADQNVLYTKTRNYHWNVLGPHFHSIHELLQEQYETLAEAIDETAERVRQLGGKAVGTMREWVELSTLPEHPGEYPDARQMLTNLRDDHEAVIRQLRQDIQTVDEEHEDVTTADFLTAQCEVHEKMAWMLGAMVYPDGSMDARANGKG